MIPRIENLSIKLFADGANLAGMIEMNEKPDIKGLTTNPTLMKQAGVKDYREFATEALSHISQKPISFEVFSDDLDIMKKQALEIASWGDNVYVKIPITNTRRESTSEIVKDLVSQNVKVNVTALMTLEQVKKVATVLDTSVPSYVSVFAGRIADTGRDPLPIMKQALDILGELKNTELIWASPRELLNVFQADEVGCHIITATNEILKKLSLVGRDLDDYSLETVNMFFQDSLSSKYSL